MPTKRVTKAQLEEKVVLLENKVDMMNDALEMSLAVSPERDNNFFTGGLSSLYTDPLNRSAWDRKKVLSEGLRAWRVNPIARRLVKLYTSYVIGKGLEIHAPDDPETDKFIQEWVNKNRLKKNLKRWKDEDTRSGNLFMLYNVQPDGMTIVRATPAELIDEIETAESDVETELAYTRDATATDKWQAYQPDQDQSLFMLHFTSNQPVGSPWGESDLSPLLIWIGRFSSWLEDRVRLNRYRSAFMYVVRGAYTDEGARAARERSINANPPKPGSVLVVNANQGEDWGILSANLDSFDASVDGMAIKKNILAGAGIPPHWLAEPEDSNRSTAEAAGTPTFRTLEEMQDDFFEVVIEMVRVALQVKAKHGGEVNPNATIKVGGPDITERDNAQLALALGRAYPQLSDLYDREGIDEKEFLRLTYKMFAEVWEGKETPTIKRKPLMAPGVRPQGIEDETDPDDPKDDE
jgi:hypothetical protein